MKPDAWQKTQPAMPLTSDSFSSRMPHHADGMLSRLAKLLELTLTAWMRHFFSRVSSKRQNSTGFASPISFSRSYRCSFQGQTVSSRMIWQLGSTLGIACSAALTCARAGSHTLPTHCTASRNSPPVSSTAFRKRASRVALLCSSFQAGLSAPTRALRPVLLTYLGGSSLIYCWMPLSIASTASTKFLYTRKYTVSRSAWSTGMPRILATISRPKCLYTSPALDSFVLKPWPNTPSNSRWWWSKRKATSSYTAPTSMTMSACLSTSGSRDRTISASLKRSSWRSIQQPRASSQWNDPECVPI
mmetsp:Transcript_186/g.480  ORF Transcript_186/g.480 Transcript_186/m.480 type:complete len:302 (+) Transcript_186:1227-2132(+)